MVGRHDDEQGYDHGEDSRKDGVPGSNSVPSPEKRPFLDLGGWDKAGTLGSVFVLDHHHPLSDSTAIGRR